MAFGEFDVYAFVSIQEGVRLRVLAVGIFFPAVSGVATANDVFAKLGVKKGLDIVKINMAGELQESLGAFSFSKIVAVCAKYFLLYKVVFSDVVYVTPGQTFLGVMKYAPFILVSKLLRKKVIFHVHGDYVHSQYQQLAGVRRFLYWYVISRADAGVVLSDRLRRNLLPFLKPSSIFSVPNCVSNNLLTVNGLAEKKFDFPRLVFLSNLLTEKGIGELLHAVKMLKELNVKFELRIAGDIDNKRKESFLESVSTYTEVEYLGVVRGEAKEELLRWSNIFVLPTYFQMEGQPISILEAMVMRNCIVTTEHAGIPDIVKEKINGYFCEARSAESLATTFRCCGEKMKEVEEIASLNMNHARAIYTENRFLDDMYAVLCKTN